MSDARTLANRSNAQKSTGPKTVEGKARSRANALKHGFRAEVIPVEDPATLHERTIGVYDTIRPQNLYQAWACERVALFTIRLDRVAALEAQVRAGAAWRALSFWDDDQRREAERIAARLASEPSRTVGLLRRSVAGCDWLIERWAFLANAADQQAWTGEQQKEVQDLLGTPREVRGNAPGHLVDVNGYTVPNDQTESQLARAALAELNAHRALVEEADAIARSLAEADADDFNNRDLLRLRRYERAMQLELHRHWVMSQHESPHACTNARLARTIPAEFFDSPTSPNEANTPAEPTLPNEANLAEPVVANEAINPAESTLPNEAKSAEPTLPNEANNPAEPILPNEANATPAAAPPEPGVSQRPTTNPALAGLHPTLAALLEFDEPEFGTFETPWGRDYIAANLDRILGADFGAEPPPPPIDPATGPDRRDRPDH